MKWAFRACCLEGDGQPRPEMVILEDEVRRIATDAGPGCVGWPAPGDLVIRHIDCAQGAFDFVLTLRHLLCGQILHQTGRFRDRPAANPGS